MNEIYVVVRHSSLDDSIQIDCFFCLESAREKVRSELGQMVIDLAQDCQKDENLVYFCTDIKNYSHYTSEDSNDGFIEGWSFGNSYDFKIYKKSVE